MLQRLVAAVAGLLAIGVLVIFASILLAFILAAALVIGGWLWWRTRHVRRAAKKRPGTIIEGEFRDASPAVGIEVRSEARSERLPPS